MSFHATRQPVSILIPAFLACSLASAAFAQAPPNDTCAGADVIASTPYTAPANMLTGPTATDDLDVTCNSSTATTTNRGVWFTYTPTQNGSGLLAQTSTNDTVMAVFTGSCAGLTQIACSDPNTSAVPMTAGTQYWILVGMWSGTTVPTLSYGFTFNFATPPANDACTGAEVIASTPYVAPSGAVSGQAATNDVDITCNSSTATGTTSGVWFTYTPTQNGTGNLVQTSTNDTAMAVFTGSCAGLTQIACSDPNTLAVAMTAGTQYWILLGMWSTTAPSTNYGLSFDFVTPPANDTCGGAIALSLDTPVAGSTAGATNDYVLTGATAFVGVVHTTSTAPGRDVAYSFTAPSAGKYSLRVTGYSTSQNIVLYDASSCPTGTSPITVSTALLAANRGTTNGAEELMCQTLTAGQQVFVFVDDHVTANAGSAFTIEVSACTQEAEANGTPATANAYTFGMEGSISPIADIDFFSLGTPAAGSRVFAMADGIAGNSNDFDLRVTSTTDTLEYDDAGNDTPFGSLAPNCSGTPLTGVASFLRMSHFSASTQSEPYRLFAVIQPALGAASLEAEPNDTQPNANSSGTNYFNGALSSASDVDMYSFNAAAGQLVYLGLDGDPLRNATPINAALALLNSGGTVLVTVNDGGSTSSITTGAGNLAATTPNSPGEGLTFRVLTAGTYTARVTGTAAGDYLLSIAKMPAPNYCTAGATNCASGVDEYIANVTIGSINNSSTSGAGCYSDFTAQSSAMLTGVGDTISVTNGTPFGGDQCTVWGDWNQNGSFADSGEQFTLSGGPATFTGSIVPPLGSALGTTRMRVRVQFTEPVSPCGSTTFGEVEDYTLNVTATPSAPANDNCASATSIGNGTFGGTTVAASNDGSASCDTGGASSRDVWFSYTASATGLLNVNTCTSSIDTAVAVFSACGGAELACNDDCGGSPCGGSAACLSLAVTSAQNVKIRVSDKGIGSGGTFSLTTSLSLPPANDNCASASTVGNTTTSGTTLLATNDGGASCDTGGAASRDVWYSYTAAGTGTLSIDTCGSAIDTAVAVLSACGGAELACNDDCGGTPCGATASCLSLGVSTGQIVKIRVSDKGIGSGGSFTLKTSFALPNDNCTGAIALACPSITSASNIGAAVESGLPTCTGPGPGSVSGGSFVVSGLGVWYSVSVPSDQTITADTITNPATLGFDTRVSVYTGPCGSLSCITVNDDINTPAFRSKVAWHAQAGVLYYVLVGGFSSSTTGNFVLTLSCDPTPANDDCAMAQPIGPANGSAAGTTVGATGEASSLTAAGLATCATNSNVSIFDVWYSYTAPCTASVTFSTCGTYDSLLSVYSLCPTASTSNQLVPTASSCNNNGTAGCTPGSFVTVSLTQGMTYLVRVAGNIGAAAGGSFGLSWASPDTDGDGTLDCLDGCPLDPGKVAPGQCGCGQADTDTDGDGTADCNDGCPADPNKIAPGICGCGVADTDTDGDGTADCFDGCPADPNKIAPGICGCGVADTDTDGDGTADCNDGCPTDPNKIAPGMCGCGMADTDTDGDGTADCNDGCPTDPNKVAPGICGCGVADTDTDGDGTADCNDGCPTDPNKIAPGACGCGVADTDTDGDGALDCNDECPTDPAKTLKGLCGCFVTEGCSLGIDINDLSATSGGQQKFFLYGGPTNALYPYLLVGSLSGTSPGTTLGSVLLPLNVDGYTVFTYTNPNKPPYTNNLGVLNLFGFSLAKLTLPAGTGLTGLPLTVDHAYVVIDPTPLAIIFASNPVSLTIGP